METFSLDILLSQLKSVAKAHRNENFLLARLSRFRPSLVYLNDFMTVLVLSFALDGKTGALLWGGICLLLSVRFIVQTRSQASKEICITATGALGRDL